ncbi:TetR/AcrR family transcriptional regulator [Streptomyces rubellomurinus]|uniref:TetR family transcriptional regulator n=2 Tax=Streptomyces TaxID=1883 RepID=A0A0F2TAX4_STRR3|nr:TetR/AcrR family transcriptional regulator [Streptomyces rubellomurinus]KJS52708.1 TetR family transcriptional regulator [Streptomyces rubellomurinus subsp. indigoferus]KJS59606.1 TetR family transcriptional regulator [Streptomyces rubellomurinus]
MTAIQEAQERPRGARLPRSARREQLLGAAQEVFVAQGYHAAAMDDIADRAGVSKPVLYQHFPGKLELYLALLDKHCDALVESTREALSTTSDNKQRVANTMEAYFNYVSSESGAFRLVFESDLTNEPAVRERVERASEASATLVSKVIQEDTDLPEAESKLLAAGVCGLAQITARYWLSQGLEIPRDEAVRLVASLSWRGLKGFPMHAGEPGSEGSAQD